MKFIHRGSLLDRIVFVSTGQDTYFKRAALRRAQVTDNLWIENPLPKSEMFVVKWDYGEINFGKLGPQMFVNHFPSSKDLTSKQGLTKAMNAATSFGVGYSCVDKFFPRSYDMTEESQVHQFAKDFS